MKPEVEKWYYETGGIWIEWLCRYHYRHGVAKEYYPSGQLRAEISYSNNLLHGPMKYYEK